MKKIILLTLILLITYPVFAGDKNQQGNRSFFTPLEKATVKLGGVSLSEADGSLMPPSAPLDSKHPTGFTDQDLDRYKRPSDLKKSPENTQPEEKTYEFNKPLPGSKEDLQKLKRYEVPYKAFEGIARRIIIPVSFNGFVTAPMALDTGAPGMHISYRLAEKLGLLDKDNARLTTRAYGLGGSAPAILTIVDTVQVGGAKDHFVPVTISGSISSHFEGLIGMDFMTNYSIKIDTRRQMVVFEELPPRPNMPAGHNEAWWRINFHRFASMRSAWKKYKEYLDKQIDNSQRLRKLKAFADQQYKEADKLFYKLNGYASEHAVPMSWREY